MHSALARWPGCSLLWRSHRPLLPPQNVSCFAHPAPVPKCLKITVIRTCSDERRRWRAAQVGGISSSVFPVMPALRNKAVKPIRRADKKPASFSLRNRRARACSPAPDPTSSRLDVLVPAWFAGSCLATQRPRTRRSRRCFRAPFTESVRATVRWCPSNCKSAAQSVAQISPPDSGRWCSANAQRFARRLFVGEAPVIVRGNAGRVRAA